MEEVKLAIKPFYQKREVTKEEYKDILRKAVQKVGAARLLGSERRKVLVLGPQPPCLLKRLSHRVTPCRLSGHHGGTLSGPGRWVQRTPRAQSWQLLNLSGCERTSG